MGDNKKNITNPMQSKKCGADCRTTNAPCKNYSMKNGRCRMHGGKSTGRPIVSGVYTKDFKIMRKQIGICILELNNSS